MPLYGIPGGLRDINDLRYDVRSSLVTPEVILSTSKVSGINSFTDNAKEVVGFKNDRYINNPYHELTLFTIYRKAAKSAKEIMSD